jgi:hypothetical protein
VTSHTITASGRGQPLAPIAGLGCRALAGSRLLSSSLAFAIITATGGTIITASDVMIAAVTGEDPHDPSKVPGRVVPRHPAGRPSQMLRLLR